MAREHINALGAGAVIEEYRIERLLGHGGFGMTYLARDQNLNTLVALKEYLPQEFAVRAANSTIVPKSQSDEEGYGWGLDRFKQEARALARFKHPNIVRASRLIEANGTAYMVMDYEVGMTLAEYIKAHGPTLDEAHILGVFLPILDGLHALHKVDLVHRDIKPGNIYLRAEGAPMLIDFGAVRQAIGLHSRSLTAVVTPGFAPIEQYSSESKQGPWTDLYSVGATMYTCVLGRSPVDAARRSAAISDGESDPLMAAARIGKDKYGEALLAAIDWALQFRTKDRPQSVEGFQAALRKSSVAPVALKLSIEEERAASGATVRDAAAAPRVPSPFGNSRSAAAVPSGDADVASAPLEWFEPNPAAAAAAPRATPVAPPAAAKAPPPKAAPPKPVVPAPITPPRGQPTRDPDDDPLAQSQAGLIASAAANVKPTKAAAKAAAKPTAPAAAKPAASGAPRRAPGSGSGLIANAAAGARPPEKRGPGTVIKVLLSLAVVGAAVAGFRWFQEDQLVRREARLWAAAKGATTIAAYQSYLATCERCDRRDDAAAEIVRLQHAAERAAAAAAAADAQLAQLAELKTRFAQHVMAGEIDQPATDNATTVLAELAALAPDDVFVISGRERLALMAADHRTTTGTKPSAPPLPAPAAARVVEPAAETIATKPTAVAKPSVVAKPKPRPAKPAVVVTSTPGSSSVQPAPPVDESALLFDLVAKFELALLRGDLDGGPSSASVNLRALETIAPNDPIVRDVRQRYQKMVARAAAEAATPTPTGEGVALPSEAPTSAPASAVPAATAPPSVPATPASVPPPEGGA